MENKFNVRAVSEKFKQYDDFLKLFSGVQGEYHGKLDDDQQKADDFWFDEVDQKIFTSFKHSVHNYLQENERIMSRRSGSSRKTKSSSSSSSSKSRKSGKSIKQQQVINEKMKLAELEALASFKKQQKTKKLVV